MPAGFRFTINWRLTGFSAVFFPVLVCLGFWQLSRADEKALLLENWSLQQSSAPIEIGEESTFVAEIGLKPYQRVQFSAYFLPERYWLLEGRIYRSRPGYDVIMPARLPNFEVILINRGWVPAHPDRRILPDIDTLTRTQLFSAEVRLPSDTALVDESNNALVDWPHRVLEATPNVMSKQLGQRLPPFIFALNPESPGAFVVQSLPINMPPEKHRGYALQWFTMAFALFLLWFITNTNLILVIRGQGMKKHHE